MTQDSTISPVLDVAHKTIAIAGCASLVTMDETGWPSARAVAAFPPDENFSKMVIATHPDSRKTTHVKADPRVLLSYLELENRGYVTIIGHAHLDDDREARKAYWTDRFSAFWPDGPESDAYQLIVAEPERLEVRSFGLGVAEDPTRWSPVILERRGSGAWAKNN
ncbi:MAG: pyridoxamine 5'-phosphate oxidase family protein [Rhodovibrionaceae bacterium]|nr:pyridoxamine 5'-phosphate oxidase family protein [Rhodovibrionaceae bacterium]